LVHGRTPFTEHPARTTRYPYRLGAQESI
jgi:hypothetical protein